MSADPRTDVVARQYERWQYPAPIHDLPAWMRNNWQWFDPVHAHRVLWPARAPRAQLDILVAGCGTNQAAVLACANPEARVVGIDVSHASLAHEQALKDSHGLANLDLRLLPIEEAGSLAGSFDLIVSTGVLHHLADPAAGLRRLGACLKPDGVLGLMLYGRYGRLGVGMLQSVFRDLELGQDEASLGVVRDAIALLPDRHPLRRYLASAPDLNSAAGLVDTFLHGRERDYAVDDCLDLVEAAGLTFQGWFFNAPYHVHESTPTPNRFQARVQDLPLRQQWSVMERVRANNACHFFMACRADRPAADYQIDFADPQALEYVPELRMRCGLEGNELVRPGWRMALNPAQLPCVQQVDGRRSIGEIAARVEQQGASLQADAVQAEAFARDLFRKLWQLDFLAMARQPARRAPGSAA